MPLQFKEERQICYTARDNFWSCLDLNNDDAKKCQKLRREFEKSCSKQWVKHFDRKREYDKFKAFGEANNWEALPNQGRKE